MVIFHSEAQLSRGVLPETIDNNYSLWSYSFIKYTSVKALWPQKYAQITFWNRIVLTNFRFDALLSALHDKLKKYLLNDL